MYIVVYLILDGKYIPNSNIDIKHFKTLNQAKKYVISLSRKKFCNIIHDYQLIEDMDDDDVTEGKTYGNDWIECIKDSDITEGELMVMEAGDEEHQFIYQYRIDKENNKTIWEFSVIENGCDNLNKFMGHHWKIVNIYNL